MATHTIVPPEPGERLAIRGERRTGRTHALDGLRQLRGDRATVSITAAARLSDVALGAFRARNPAIETAAEASTELRRALGREGLLLVDDAQWLDTDTVSAIALVAPQVGLAYTTTGHDPLVTRTTRIEPLRPLDAPEMGQLVENRLGGPVHRAFVDQVLRRSDGRSGVAVPLVDAALATGAVTERFGVWVGDVPGDAEIAAAPALAEIVSATDRERRVLEYLTIGGPLSAELLGELADDPESLDALESAGLISGEIDRLDVAIPVVRGLVLGTTTPLRRSMIEARLVEADPDRYADPRDPTSAAIAVRNGVSVDVARLAAMAERAIAAGRADEAAAFADRLPAGFPRSMLHTHAALIAGRADEARAHAAAAFAFADSDDELARAGVLEAQLIAMGGHDLDSGLQRLRELETRVTDPSARRQLDAISALLHTYAGRIEPALALGANGRPLEGPEVVARSLAMAVSGRPGVDDLIDSATPPDPVTAVLLEINRWFGAFAAAELDRGVGLLTELAGQTVHSPIAGVVQANLASAYTLRGDLERARISFAEALGTLTDSDPLATLQAAWAFRVLAAAMAREPGHVDLAAEFRRSVTEPMPFAAGFRSAAEAWIALTAGDRARADAVFTTSADEFESAGMHAFANLAHHGRLLAGGTAQVAVPRGALSELVADEAVATAAADQAALDDVGDRYLRGGFAGWAADVFQRADEAAADERGRAIRSFRAAAALRDAPGYRPPWVDRFDQIVSPRELEVACLAAAGRSSPDIADTLHVSTRTVDNHLGRVYAKLQIEGRGELATLLPGSDPV